MALQNEFKVVIGGDDKPLQDAVERSKKSLSALVLGIGVGVGESIFERVSQSVHAFIEGSIHEFEEAERSAASLKQSLEAIGREDVFEGIIKSSKDLAQQFKFVDNDDITTAFQKLIQVGGLTEDAIHRLLPLIIDLNAKQKLAGDTNKTVASTAEDIVRGLNGQGRELKKYGVELSRANTEAQNLSIIFDQLGPKVQGAADAFGNSLEGNIAATTIRVEELQEALGGKLLPLKAKLLQFANEVADGFGLLIDRLQLGATKFESLRNLKVKVDFVEGESTKKFDAIKNLPLDELTSELIKYQAALDKTNAAIRANKSGKVAIDQWKLEAEVVTNLIGKLKEQVRLRGDSRTLGSHIKNEANDHKKVTDALKIRIAALKELIAAGVEVSKNSIELKNLDIELILRDAKAKGFSQAEVEKLIFAKYPDFKGGLTLSQPIQVTAPISIGIGVQKSIEQFDAAGDNLAEGISRMYARMNKQGQEDGAEARKKILQPLLDLQSDLNSIVSSTFIGIAESIGEAFSGANPVKAFVEVIATALDQLGRALILFGIAKKLALDSLKTLNPYIALAAGAGAIIAAKLLRSQLGKEHKFAEGGIVMGPTRGLIGESGPEAIIPLSRANSFTNQQPFQGRVTFEIEGRKLRGVLIREEESNGRRGG